MAISNKQDGTRDFNALKDSYLYSPARSEIDSNHSSPFWAKPITRLVQAGYSFMSNCFEEGGYLFRGMDSGLLEATVAGRYGHFCGSREESRVERIMDIYFITHELSDALTVSDLKKDNDGGGILVLSARQFNHALARGEAAVLSIGDSGMVFRYPFLTEMISLDNLAALIVHETLANKLIEARPELQDMILPIKREFPRNENTLRHLLYERDIIPAGVLPAINKPGPDNLIRNQVRVDADIIRSPDKE